MLLVQYGSAFTQLLTLSAKIIGSAWEQLGPIGFPGWGSLRVFCSNFLLSPSAFGPKCPYLSHGRGLVLALPKAAFKPYDSNQSFPGSRSRRDAFEAVSLNT